MAVGSVAEEKDENLACEQDRAAAGGANGVPKARRRYKDAAQRVPSRAHWSRSSWTAQVKETDLHRAVAKYLGWVLAPPAMFTTFPSGWGKLGRAMAGQLKDCGLLPGMPDILIFSGKGAAVGLELKTPTGVLSPAQKQTKDKLELAEVPVYVCRSLKDVELVLEMRKIPRTGRIAA